MPRPSALFQSDSPQAAAQIDSREEIGGSAEASKKIFVPVDMHSLADLSEAEEHFLTGHFRAVICIGTSLLLQIVLSFMGVLFLRTGLAFRTGPGPGLRAVICLSAVLQCADDIDHCCRAAMAFEASLEPGKRSGCAIRSKGDPCFGSPFSLFGAFRAFIDRKGAAGCIPAAG